MKQRCKEILERAQVLIDGELGFISEVERVEIMHHLEECQPCLERHGLEREMVVLIGERLRRSPACPDDLRARIASLIREV